MSVKLTPEIEPFVEACDGVASVGGEHQSYVVMSAERFRGCFESDEDHAATLEAIRRGWDDMLNGRTTPMEVFFQEFDRKHGISKLNSLTRRVETSKTSLNTFTPTHR